MIRTPGELRPLNLSVLQDCINKGVRNGDFGIGTLTGDKPIYVNYKENCPVVIEENEIIINPEKIPPPSDDSSPEPEPEPEPDTGGGGSEGGGKEEIQTKKRLIITTNILNGKSYTFTEIFPKIDKCFKNIQIRIECEDGEISEEEIDNLKKILGKNSAYHNVE